MSSAMLYNAHIAARQHAAEAALAAAGFGGMVIQAGMPFTYFADDQDAPFRTTPHFTHWVPLDGPHHLLHIRPGKRPLLVRVRPEDYWYEQAPLGNPFWLDAFEFHEVADLGKAWKLIHKSGRTAYIGDDPAGSGIGVEHCNPEALVKRLDWDRAYKTDYEIACLEQATIAGARGHAAARQCFLEGGSELEIHHAFVEAVGCTDRELPYETIVALDDHGAILHYCGKRTQRNGKVLLIDCGAKHNGYGSDITRTWTSRNADSLFQDLLHGMDQLQLELCEMVRPGLPYLAIHEAAHVKIADLLHKHGILKVGGAQAVSDGLTGPFFPHGVGHFLGVQVHDVGGRQSAPGGGVIPPPKSFPYLRTTRTIEANQVFTIEPGVYFIEMLLRPFRSGPQSGMIDWKLVDRLASHGGIRIEDNVVAVPGGQRNLTRPHI
jgi:Xaa-Pro dipeptidase